MFRLMYVISVDTQGTEDMVLQGAAASLRKSAVAVIAEVSFREAYEGQPLFGDICKIMHDQGFNFVRFRNGRRDDTSSFRCPIGWRGRAGSMFDDAIFFRDPRHIEAEATDATAALLKLAYIALCFGNVESTVECFRRVSKRDDVARASTARPYQRFLMTMLQLYEQEEHVWMAKFTELFDANESLHRFEPNILHYWNIYNVNAARQRYFDATNRDVFCRRASELLDDAPSAVEQLLISNGFEAVAEDLGVRRRNDMEAVARMLHCLHHRDPTDALNLKEICEAEIMAHVCPVRRRQPS